MAEENDLFDALDKAAKEDKTLADNLNVRDLFGSWSNQKGFPLLKVTRNYENGSVTISQERYTQVYRPDEIDPSTWWIPYNFASANNPEFDDTTPSNWLPKGTREILIEPNNETQWKNTDWLLFNRQQTGFYRILYDEENYKLVNKALNSNERKKIHPLTRSQYLNDLYEFVRSGRLKPQVLIEALRYLKDETSYAPWVSAINAITELKQIFEAKNKSDDFNKFVVKLATPFYRNKTLNAVKGEGPLDISARSIAVNLACEFGVSQCLNETYKKFKNFIEHGTGLSPDNRGLIFANGIRSAKSNEIEIFLIYFLNNNLTCVRKEAIASFSNIRKSSDIEQILDKTIEGSANLSKSEQLAIIDSIIIGNRNNLMLIIQFLHRNLDKFNNTNQLDHKIFEKIAEKIITSEANAQVEKIIMKQIEK